MHRRRSRLAAAGLVVPLLALAACGDDSDAGGVEVSGAWARTSPMMAEAGAAYLQISADETTSIVSASVDPSVAGTIELHETVPVGESDGEHDHEHEGEGEHEGHDDDMAMDDGEMDMGDGEMAMTMQEVSSINLPAGETVSLEPGGLHVMMLDLPDPLEAGEEFDLTLTLEDGEEVVVGVEVRDEAP
ncbi:MAG: copper chaperone PCu(A)C [Actinomycetota bacterium]